MNDVFNVVGSCADHTLHDTKQSDGVKIVHCLHVIPICWLADSLHDEMPHSMHHYRSGDSWCCCWGCVSIIQHACMTPVHLLPLVAVTPRT
jgi:hypothetical protein